MEELQETKEEKFVRIAEYRMNKAIKDIESIRNLSNRSSYSYTEEQVNTMFQTLEDTVTDVKSAFAPKKVGKSAFSFSNSEGSDE